MSAGRSLISLSAEMVWITRIIRNSYTYSSCISSLNLQNLLYQKTSVYNNNSLLHLLFRFRFPISTCLLAASKCFLRIPCHSYAKIGRISIFKIIFKIFTFVHINNLLHNSYVCVWPFFSGMEYPASFLRITPLMQEHHLSPGTSSL